MHLGGKGRLAVLVIASFAGGIVLAGTGMIGLSAGWPLLASGYPGAPSDLERPVVASVRETATPQARLPALLTAPVPAEDEPGSGAASAGPPDEPVRIALGGDVNAAPPIQGHLLGGDALLDDLATVLGSVDLSVVNLETAVGVRGTPADKQFTFQAPSELVVGLRDAGVDVVSLANNHALDYGVEALLETIEEAEAAGLQVVGAGRDAAEAYAPVLIDVRGTTIAVVGLTRVIPVADWAATETGAGLASAYDEEAAVAAVRSAARQADRTVVMIHWGVEVAACPVPHQQRLARLLTAAGADVIAGHHPHVLQGLEEADGAVIAYSLGNLVFPSRHEATRRTGLLVVELDDAGPHAELTPFRIDDRGSPRLLGGEDADDVRARVAALRPGAGVC